jgi:hypothetical protein
MLGTARGEPAQLQALYGTRLQFWLTQVIDTTVRGFVYEAAGTVAPELLDAGAALVREACERNAIPYAVIDVPPADPRWLGAAQAGVDSFLAPSS